MIPSRTEIGTLLRTQREARGLTFDEIFKQLKIRAHYLKRLEEGEADGGDLPAVCILGHLRTYGYFLGLNGDYLANCYKVEDRVPLSLSLGFPEPYREDLRPGRGSLIFSFVLTLILYSVWTQFAKDGYMTGDQSTRYISEALAKPYQEGVSSDAASTPSLSMGRYLQQFQNQNYSMVLLATSSTRVRILDSNHQILAEQTMQAGDTYFVPDEKGLTIIADNPEAIEMLTNGELMQLKE